MIIDLNKTEIINVFYGKVNKLKKFKSLLNSNFEINKNTMDENYIDKLYINLKNKNKYVINYGSNISHKNNKIYVMINNSIIKDPIVKEINIVKNSIPKINKIRNSNNFVQKYNYILSTNVRDENNIIEFIIYHLMIGFDHIYIIDHLSKKSVREQIKVLPCDMKNKVTVFRFNKEGSYKLYFLNTIIIPFMKKHCNKYFIHLDGDEYINLNNNFKNINEFINYLNCPEILLLNWVLYGSNNKEYNDNKYNCLIPTFEYCEGKLNNHFKILIKANILNEDIHFINPHQIFSNIRNLVYTNILNDKNVFNNKLKIAKLFEDTLPNNDLKSSSAFLNHYTIQSKKDYIFRKVNRSRDDKNENRILDNNIFNLYNNVKYNNLGSYYKNIVKILDVDDIGFIILRNVINDKTNTYWIECYNCIRNFYDNKIYIIDDNSDKKYLTNHKTTNCYVINSEYKKRGELLPYFYYLSNKFCRRLIVLHDSMFIKKKLNFKNINGYKNFTRIFSFSNKCYNIDIEYFKLFCDNIKNGDTVFKYHKNNINKLIGCFGVCYIIEYDFLKKIDDKYNIKNLIKVIDNRDKRKTLERFLSCLFEMEYNSDKRPDFLGTIFKTLTLINEKKPVSIYKIFSGR